MPVNKFPSFSEYQDAVQHPEIAFSHNFLRNGTVECDLWGFPRVRSGGFALTYKVAVNGSFWATRCFHRGVKDRASRYIQISKFLDSCKLPFFVPTTYLYHGIKIFDKVYPISALKWVEGDSLENYLLHHLEETQSLETLLESFRVVCRQLEEGGIAHGDLSHRNILVNSDHIFLIDYDGIYVPNLKGRRSCELGNIHFQHPERSSIFFNSKLDRFSEIIIYLAILALSREPSLWLEFQSGGEGLLFQQSDFLNPSDSKLLKRFEKSCIAPKLITKFRHICQSPIGNIPSLEEFLEKPRILRGISPPSEVHTFQTTSIAHVLSSEKLEVIIDSVGSVVTIVGEVTEVFHGTSNAGGEHIFINFGNWQENCFTAVIWGKVLADLEQFNIQIDNLVGKWVSIGGLVTMYRSRPQIQLESITDLFQIDSERSAAKFIENFSGGKSTRFPYLQSGFSKKIEKPNRKENSNSITKGESQSSQFVSNTIKLPQIPEIESTINQLYAEEKFKVEKGD
jgi:predicted Ser/Thr protein kinase